MIEASNSHKEFKKLADAESFQLHDMARIASKDSALREYDLQYLSAAINVLINQIGVQNAFLKLRFSNENETEILSEIIHLLGALEPDQRRRILSYLWGKFVKDKRGQIEL